MWWMLLEEKMGKNWVMLGIGKWSETYFWKRSCLGIWFYVKDVCLERMWTRGLNTLLMGKYC